MIPSSKRTFPKSTPGKACPLSHKALHAKRLVERTFLLLLYTRIGQRHVNDPLCFPTSLSCVNVLSTGKLSSLNGLVYFIGNEPRSKMFLCVRHTSFFLIASMNTPSEETLYVGNATTIACGIDTLKSCQPKSSRET
jgi:hypothetical protein